MFFYYIYFLFSLFIFLSVASYFLKSFRGPGTSLLFLCYRTFYIFAAHLIFPRYEFHNFGRRVSYAKKVSFAWYPPNTGYFNTFQAFIFIHMKRSSFVPSLMSFKYFFQNHVFIMMNFKNIFSHYSSWSGCLWTFKTNGAGVK